MKLDPWGSSQFQDYARLRDTAIAELAEHYLSGKKDPKPGWFEHRIEEIAEKRAREIALLPYVGER